jgi:hypothetical protein
LSCGHTRWRILFRYRPVIRERSDLALCYRCNLEGPAGATPVTAVARVRWMSDAGHYLLWETPRRTIQLFDMSGWTSLPVDVPLVPRDAKFARFEIIVEHQGDRLAVCTGFVQFDGTMSSATEAVAMRVVPHSDADPPLPGTYAHLFHPIMLSARRLGQDGSGLLVLNRGLIDNRLGDRSSLYVANWRGGSSQLLEAPLNDAALDTDALLALPETLLKNGDVRVFVKDSGGKVLPAYIRVGSTTLARRRSNVKDRNQISAVVTSCGRQDLLETTLDSFFAFNSFPITQTIIVEDGPGEANASLMQKYAQRNITWLATDRRIGQIAAIDYAYAFVETPYIFHVEDDWQFYRSGFIEKSLAILEAMPRCLQVWIRALHDTNRQPVAEELERVDGVAFRKVLGYLERWYGFSFNPGLRRTADYGRIGQYGWHVRYDRADPDDSEWRLSTLFKELGFHAVILADNDGKGYVRHLGFGRRVVDRAFVGW